MRRGVHCTAVRGHRTTGIWLVWYGAIHRVLTGYSRGTHDILDKLAGSASVGHALHVRFSGRFTQRRAVHRTTENAGLCAGYLKERYSWGTHMGCSRHAYRVSAAVAAFRGRGWHGAAAQSGAHRSVVCLVWHYWVLTGNSRYRDRFGTLKVLKGAHRHSAVLTQCIGQPGWCTPLGRGRITGTICRSAVHQRGSVYIGTR